MIGGESPGSCMDWSWRPLVWLPGRLQLSTTIYTPFSHWFGHGFWLRLPDASDRAIPGRLYRDHPPLADAIDRPHALMPTPGNGSDIKAVPALHTRADRDRSSLKR